MAATGTRIPRIAGPFLVALARWAHGNVAWLVGGSVVGAVLLKIAAVSRGNLETALAIVQAADPTKVALGTFLLVAPSLLVYAFVLLLVGVARHISRGPATLPAPEEVQDAEIARRVRVIAYGGAAGLVATVIIALTPAYFALEAAVLAGFVAPLLAAVYWIVTRAPANDAVPARIEWADRHPRAAEAVASASWVGGVALVTGMLLGSVFNDRMWLPAHAVSRPGEPAWAGYRLGEEDDLVVYLRDDDRSVVRVPADVAATARACTPARLRWKRTLLQIVQGEPEPTTAPCPGR